MPTPVKVAHVTTIDLSLRYLLLNQMISLETGGYQITGISSPGPEAASLQAAGIRHIPVAMTRRFTPFADLLSLWRLWLVMRRERFTIVHTHNPKPGLLGQLAGRMAGVPVIVNTLHGFYFCETTPVLARTFYTLMEKIAAACSDTILSQNREDIETAIRQGICQRQKITYLGNGIDIERFNKATITRSELDAKRNEIGLPLGSPVVGFVGRLVREKGILDLLTAAQSIRQSVPSVRFLFVGPTDREKEDALTSSAAGGLDIADSCLFVGQRDDMPSLYACMDVFVLPSHREGFPRSPMEASAMAVPCVVTDVRGCREAVEHNRNGVLVPLGDVEALANAIIDLLSDREKARRMGEEGRRMALERFDERLVFEKVKAEYARLLREKGLPVPEPLPTLQTDSA